MTDPCEGCANRGERCYIEEAILMSKPNCPCMECMMKPICTYKCPERIQLAADLLSDLKHRGKSL